MVQKHLVYRTIIALFLVVAYTSSSAAPSPAKSLRIYLQCVDRPDIKRLDTVHVTYNVNYPFLELIRDRFIVTPNDINKVFPLTVTVHSIRLNSTSLLVNLGDTIQFSINKEHHLVLHGADTTMYNIGNYKNNPFYSKYRSPSIAMLDTMTISDYVFYCEGFSKKEQDHINLTFGLRKPALKKYLIQKSGFNLIKDLLNGYKKAGLTKDDSIAFTSRREVQWLHNPYTPYDESYRLALGSYVELLAGESNNDYSPTKFSKLLDVSTEVLAIDQQQYFRLSLLKRISTISQSEYDYVTRRIFKELSLSKLSVKERAKINALYHNALVMSKKIYDLPAIKMQKISGEFVELKSIMQPGKFLLIDFWASWCGPCIAEIPFLNKLSTTYAQLQVVSISIDEDKQNWLKATAKYKVNEDQNFLIPNVKQSKFLQNFQIKEIPRFLLFDRDGKCITASAPSPSDSHFDGYLQNILQKQ